MLPILKDIREKIGKGPGDTVDVILERDETVRTVEIPPALKTLLKKENLLPLFEKLSYTHRKEYLPLDHGSQEGRDAPGSPRQGRRDAAQGRQNARMSRILRATRVNPPAASSVSFPIRSLTANRCSARESVRVPLAFSTSISHAGRNMDREEVAFAPFSSPLESFCDLCFRPHSLGPGRDLVFAALSSPSHG